MSPSSDVRSVLVYSTPTAPPSFSVSATTHGTMAAPFVHRSALPRTAQWPRPSYIVETKGQRQNLHFTSFTVHRQQAVQLHPITSSPFYHHLPCCRRHPLPSKFQPEFCTIRYILSSQNFAVIIAILILLLLGYPDLHWLKLKGLCIISSKFS